MIESIFLPPPFAVTEKFIGLLNQEFVFEHLFPSIFRVTSAFLISTIVALPLGMICGQFRLLARLIEPICGFMRYLPVAALIPLCILWFGVDNSQKIAVISIGIVFQLLLLFASDSASVPKELVEAGRTFGLSELTIIRRIVLPWSMPAIWDHLRISAGWAWSYLVMAELVAGNHGVGYFIVQAQRFLETAQVFAGILFIGLLGAMTDFAFRIAGKRMFQWK